MTQKAQPLLPSPRGIPSDIVIRPVSGLVGLGCKTYYFAPSQVLPFSKVKLSGILQNCLNESKTHLPLRGQHRNN